MNISLFEHNRKAYQSAVSMLSKTGKAAIIHPTGTGKSFIGFKLCEDNPQSNICWLSPSEYIFNTQIENLQDVFNGYVPQNIKFYTYAKLMLMDEKELCKIQPDFIILDEFHRCGAEMWGKGVQNLLKIYPKAYVLGLSATNIRYLDNQRDMADELFDGNIASEMTLGEAIVRGILNTPTYVLSVFSYKKDLEKYRIRIKKTKNKAVKDKAEKDLEALRRALEKAEGLDEVFSKHMPDTHGKYIIFCANVEHLHAMVNKSSEWFAKVDQNPKIYKVYCEDPANSKDMPDIHGKYIVFCANVEHLHAMVNKSFEWFAKVDRNPKIYKVYCEDPANSKEFEKFKKDDSDHLKLLYCIDMLNEGIHVDDVSGVILLRPTVSPIIYKQQIGRALSASKKKNAVIFDIVLNIENLYSIGAIEQEMQATISYYRFLGKDKKIINSKFNIIDEVKDCRQLFDQLNDTLSTSWDLMYRYAKLYYEKFGDLIVPRRYKTDEGYSLGNWIFTQRKIYNGEQYGNLCEEKIVKLEDIGMIWGNFRDLSWNRFFAEAKKYYETYGNLNINATYVSTTGFKLGSWINNMRTYKKNNIQKNYLSDKRISALNEIGMIWDIPDYLWQQNYYSAMMYYRKYGNLDIPAKYINADGVKLGRWIVNLRQSYNKENPVYKLSDSQISQLKEIGMKFEGKFERQWNQGYEEAKAYFNKYHNLNIPLIYKTPSKFALGKWIIRQRQTLTIKSNPERFEKLNKLGMVWGKPDSWENRFELVKKYYEEHGNLNISPSYVSEGVWLNKWLNEQKLIYHGKRKNKQLSDEQVKKLISIGMDFKDYNYRAWDIRYEAVKKYYDQHGNIKIAPEEILSDGKKIFSWFAVQRKYRKEGKLLEEQVKKLDALGFIWEFGDSWEIGYSHAKRYFQENGNLEVSSIYKCADGYRLGTWIANQREKHSKGELEKKYSDKLDSIGIEWLSSSEKNWESHYLSAERYFREHGDLVVPSDYIDESNFALGKWIRKMRVLKNKLKKSGANRNQIERLNAIGMVWQDNENNC